MNKLQELKQELEDVNSYVAHYEKKQKKEEVEVLEKYPKICV